MTVLPHGFIPGRSPVFALLGIPWFRSGSSANFFPDINSNVDAPQNRNAHLIYGSRGRSWMQGPASSVPADRRKTLLLPLPSHAGATLRGKKRRHRPAFRGLARESGGPAEYRTPCSIFRSQQARRDQGAARSSQPGRRSRAPSRTPVAFDRCRIIRRTAARGSWRAIWAADNAKKKSGAGKIARVDDRRTTG